MCTKINDIVRFHPIFNEDVIALNQRFGWGIPRGVIVFIAILGILMMIFSYWFINCYKQYIIKEERVKKWLNILIMLESAGALAFLCDQIFLGKTLDYLEIRSIGILDLKDIYLFLGVAVMLGLVVFTKSE